VVRHTDYWITIGGARSERAREQGAREQVKSFRPQVLDTGSARAFHAARRAAAPPSPRTTAFAVTLALSGSGGGCPKDEGTTPRSRWAPLHPPPLLFAVTPSGQSPATDRVEGRVSIPTVSGSGRGANTFGGGSGDCGDAAGSALLRRTGAEDISTIFDPAADCAKPRAAASRRAIGEAGGFGKAPSLDNGLRTLRKQPPQQPHPPPPWRRGLTIPSTAPAGHRLASEEASNTRWGSVCVCAR
jgi:hypothetical protein